MLLIAEMEDALRRSGLRGDRPASEECKALRVCQLVQGQREGEPLTEDFGVAHLDLGRRLVQLMDQGRYVKDPR